MGLFTEASLKAQPLESSAPESAVSAEGPMQPTAIARDLAIAGDLESGLDVLWARLRNRRLSTAGTGGQSFVISHWEPQEGATTLAAALAHRAAQVDPACTFCLIDFDLFGAGLSFLTELESEPGISNVLLGQAALEESFASTTLPNLTIIPAGHPTVGRHVAQLTDRCQELCEILAERFNYVLLDMPCLRKHPNFAFWASGLAQAVLVVRAGKSRRPVVARALGALELMRLDVAGVVLNAREYFVPKWLYART
jgi:Mrp family chromosome partitioning ATPase